MTKKMTLYALAAPIAAEQLLRSLMGTIHTFMLSRICDEASAAVGVANQILNLTVIAATMIACGSAVLINQRLGAGSEKQAGQVAANGIFVSAFCGLISSFIMICFARSMVTAIGLDPGLAPDACAYLRIVGASGVFQFGSTAIAAVFRCRGKAQIAMLAVTGNNAFNLLGSFLVVQEYLPIRGVSGVAWIRLISEGLGFVLLAIVLWQEKWGCRPSIQSFCLKTSLHILRLGFMTSMEGIFFTAAQLITTGMLCNGPADVLSAKVYVQTINPYAYMLGMSIGQASQILAGQRIGAGETNRADTLIKKTWSIVLGCNLLFSMLFYLFSNPIMGFFTQTAAIKRIAKTLFLIDIATCMGRALNHSYNYGLRSAGYVFWPVLFACASMLLIQVGVGCILAYPLKLGIFGIWLAQALDEWVRGLFAAIVWHRRNWIQTASHTGSRRVLLR